jgi:hypothetical protein
MPMRRSIMHEPSVTSKVGNMSKPSARQTFKIILMPVWKSTLSCRDVSPVHLAYALKRIIHHKPAPSTHKTTDQHSLGQQSC